MHTITTGKVIFTAKETVLNRIADYCEREQFGDLFFEDDGENLTLTLDDNWSEDDKDGVIEFMRLLNKKFPKAKITMIGTISTLESDESKQFECRCSKDYIKYRETDWTFGQEPDEDLSYEEFEEETNIDLDEEEYQEYVHRAKEGIETTHRFGEWEYFD